MPPSVSSIDATELLTSDSLAAVRAPAAPRPRLDSVDLLRGIIMVVMSLDHVRDFFTHLRFAPEDLQQTWPMLFFTRWITHFCAPCFFLLAGTGAFLSSTRGRSAQQIRKVLWTRGLWLVALELTVMGFGWTFLPGWSYGGVIWALGWSMVILSVLVRLPIRWLAGVSLAVIALHNLLDYVRPQQGIANVVMSLLHAPNFFPIAPQRAMWIELYSLVPWFAVMGVGYALGALYQFDAERRRTLLVRVGITAIALFCVLRITNIYGNPGGIPCVACGNSSGDFAPQPSFAKTVMSFLDVEKYPPSLQFLLMTLGPSLIALALFERINTAGEGIVAAFSRVVLAFGRVPMFYYVLHIYLIHLMAGGVAVLFHQPTAVMHGGFIAQPNGIPLGYGHSLRFIYLIWAIANVLLYFPCRWFMQYKRTHRQWWLSYI